MASARRHDGRRADELRPVRLTPGYVGSADGSCLIEMGRTRVICTACFVPGVEKWRQGGGLGWVTAEYGMLPRSTHTRSRREAASGKQSGRTQEIQRLIGRSLRAVIDLRKLGERQITLDCDVLQADGGTRCAAITGGYVALAIACNRLVASGALSESPLLDSVAAVSVGIIDAEPVLDLDYDEDVNCDTDMNVVMTGNGGFVEVQGTAEGQPFSRLELGTLLALATDGLQRLAAMQTVAIASA